MLEFGHLTHIGLSRTLNEDTYYGDGQLGLWLVVDGMGGPEHGDLASALTRESIVREIRQGATLEQAIWKADADVTRVSHQRGASADQPPRPMGATVVSARIRAQRFQIARVGDNRGYLWRDGLLTQLSQDHGDLQPLIRKGVINRGQPRRRPHHNVITQALGVTDPEQLNVDTLSGEFAPGSQLLLCSDGLTEAVSDARIARILAWTHCSAQECADALVGAALDHGATDNITVVLIRQH